VDTFDSKTLPEHSSFHFVKDIWFPIIDEAQRVWSQSGIPISFLGSAMLLYEKLDTLLWVYGWPKYLTLSLQSPRTTFPKNLSENVERVVKLVNDWPCLMNNIPQKPDFASTLYIPPPNRKTEYEAALDRFCAALSSQKKTDWEQIRTNIYTVGFTFYWLPCVSLIIFFLIPNLTLFKARQWR
jgi:hypothetical protein